jgi:SAM-dependent methyltransferase
VYTKSERLYDAIHRWKDYKAEASRLAAIIRSYKRSSGNDLLDVACGTGGHIAHLGEAFRVEGLDVDPGMVDIARAKHPDVPVHVADMVDFDLGRRFDVVVSLFSSIGYLRTPERLALAVRNMARHVVRPGGVLIVEPYFAPQAWKPRTGAPGASVVDDPGITIVRMVDWIREADVVRSTFHYLVGTAGGVEHFTEVHEMGLFTDDQHRAAFAAAGMTATLDAEGLMGRGLYIGTWAAEAWQDHRATNLRRIRAAASRWKASRMSARRS